MRGKKELKNSNNIQKKNDRDNELTANEIW